MKAVAALLFLVPAFSVGQASLKVLNSSGQVGWATLSQRLTTSGGKSVELRLQIGEGATQVKIHRQSTYAADGTPIRKFQEETRDGGKSRRQLIATFSPEGALIVEDQAGKRSTKKAPLVASASPRAKSEFWFLRDQPAVGAIDQAYTLDLTAMDWKLSEVTYRGRENKTIKGLLQRLHRVETKTDGRTSTAWLDDQGLPVLIEDGTGLRFER